MKISVNNYNRAVYLFHKGNYKKSAALFQKFIDQGFENEDAYRFGIISFMFLNNYITADALRKSFLELHTPNLDDEYNFNLIDLHLNYNSSERNDSKIT